MEQGMLNKAVSAGAPERWITQVQNGVVTLVQRIEAGAFVVRAHDLPALAANHEIVSDALAREILRKLSLRNMQIQSVKNG